MGKKKAEFCLVLFYKALWFISNAKCPRLLCSEPVVNNLQTLLLKVRYSIRAPTLQLRSPVLTSCPVSHALLGSHTPLEVIVLLSGVLLIRYETFCPSIEHPKTWFIQKYPQNCFPIGPQIYWICFSNVPLNFICSLKVNNNPLSPLGAAYM